MNFYDILAAEKWSGGIPTMNFFDLLFAQSISGEQWQVYEGTLPATINANGDDMRQYQIFGAAGGAGDRTVQLFDKDTALDGYEIVNIGAQENENWCVSDFIPVESDTLYKSRNSGSAVLSYTDKSSQPTRLSGTLNTNGVRTLSETKFIRMNCQIWQKASCIVAKSEDLPETFVPFGYEVDMGVKSAQLFDKNATDTDNGYVAGAGLKSDGTLLSNNSVNVSEYIPVSGNTVYILRYGLESGYYDAFSACFYDISKIFISGISYSKQNPKLFTTPAAAAYVRFSFSRNDVNVVVLAKGSTIPEPLPPYSNTTTPIYIGNNPLDKDEYVDYQAGKISRYETEIKKDVSQTGWQWRWETDNVTYQTAANNRVSVGRFYPEATKEYIISAVPETFEVAVISADSSDVKTADTGWGASWTISGASAHSFCVTVRKSDNADITPSEVDGVKFKVTSLTPTNPPVTLPALPTVDGVTIVDYAGSGTAPEKVYFEYQGGKQP